MTWDPTLPADNSKIRNLGTEIRPNWEAIEEGDASFLPQALNLKNRTLLSPTPADPTAISGAYVLFSKESTETGISELFGINANSVVTQFSNAANVLDLFTGSFFIPGGLIIKWGAVINLNDTPVTYPVPFPNGTISVQLTAKGVSGAGTSIPSYVLTSPNGKEGFTLYTAVGSAVTYSYLAIGY